MLPLGRIYFGTRFGKKRKYWREGELETMKLNDGTSYLGEITEYLQQKGVAIAS